MCSVPQMAVLGGCGPKNWANSTWVICKSGATCARDHGEMASKPMASDCGDEREYQSESLTPPFSLTLQHSLRVCLHTPLSLRVSVFTLHMVGDRVEGKP